MRYVLISDVHLSEKPPSSCTGTYLEDLFDLLQQVSDIARGADAVVVAGDLFDHKAPARTSHRLVQRLIRFLDAFPCTVYVVPGNHDMTHDRYDSVQETQPLGVLFESGAVQELTGWAAFSDQLYGVPWQQYWDDEYVMATLESYRDGDGNGLVVAHAPLYPPGKELPYEFYPAGKFADAMGNRGSCFYGHVHEPHGTWHCGGVTFCNYGALSRGSLHEYNLTRPVRATIWDSATGEFQPVKLDARPASQVFRLQEKQQVTDLQGRLDSFLEQIGTSTLEQVTTESVIHALLGMHLEPELQALAEELLRVQ